MARNLYQCGVGEEEPTTARVEITTTGKMGRFEKFSWGVLGIFAAYGAGHFIDSLANFRKAGNSDIHIHGEEDSE